MLFCETNSLEYSIVNCLSTAAWYTRKGGIFALHTDVNYLQLHPQPPPEGLLLDPIAGVLTAVEPPLSGFFTFCHSHLRSFLMLSVERYRFSFSSRWHSSARKGPYVLRPVSQQSPQGCPRNSAMVEHRLFLTLEGEMSAASFLHSSFL